MTTASASANYSENIPIPSRVPKRLIFGTLAWEQTLVHTKEMAEHVGWTVECVVMPELEPHSCYVEYSNGSVERLR